MDFCDVINNLITFGLSSGKLDFTQVIIFIFIAGPLALVIWKIKGIFSFINDVRNSRINELQRILDSHKLPKEVRTGLNDEIERSVGYRITGISDVAKQKAIWQLYMQNRKLIKVVFFKKFRNFIFLENDHIIFKKGAFFWLENVLYGLFSLQFLVLSACSVFISLYRGEQYPIWGHALLYFAAVVFFLFFISFANIIPRPKECQLLEEILKPKDVDV
ncbi:hypothetical protein [Erwinia billingiae]|uniref:hypothetical protein n=1 Tax=Erwinia billingiae TaxID=182337 RepID=UPI0005A27FC7|nr:hypothetical protein [Erwinia billingiae]